MKVSLSLPIPPSANRYFRIWQGRAVRTAEANGYRNLVFIHAKNRKLPKISQPRLVALQVDWYRSMRAGDLDNRLKVTCDSLQGALYDNDRQIVEIHAYRHDGGQPRMDVTVWEVKP